MQKDRRNEKYNGVRMKKKTDEIAVKLAINHVGRKYNWKQKSDNVINWLGGRAASSGEFCHTEKIINKYYCRNNEIWKIIYCETGFL